MGQSACPDPEYHAPRAVRQYDARGIYLATTCPKCHDARMSNYRPDVLDDPNYWHDEPIDED